MQGKKAAILVFVFLCLFGVVVVAAQPKAGVASSTAKKTATMTVVTPTVTKPSKTTLVKPAVVTAVMAPVPATVAVPPVVNTATQPVMAPTPVNTNPTTIKTTESKKDSKGSVIAGWLLNILLGLIGTVATTLGGVVIRWVWQKYQLDKYIAADKIDEMVDKAVVKGINYAEEQANKLKDDPVDGAKKMDLALAAINKSLKDSGIEKKAADYLTTLVEAKLPEVRGSHSTNAKKEETASPVEEEKVVEEEKKDKADG